MAAESPQRRSVTQRRGLAVNSLTVRERPEKSSFKKNQKNI